MNITKTIRFFLPKPLEDFLDKSVLNHAYMNTRALSWKIKDCLYCNIFRRDLLNLQKKVRWQLFLQKKKWPHHSYASGYFYQGFKAVGITGKRSTEERYIEYEMDSWLSPQNNVLEVGANSGFFSIKMVLEKGCFVDAVELNPYLVEIGKLTADYFKVQDKISFFQENFLSFKAKKKYDVILSFANHYTTDGNLRVELISYFKLLRSFLVDDGLLLFESHQKDCDSQEFLYAMKNIDENFRVIKSKHIEKYERLFYVLKKINSPQ